jgi:hypothetical protein
MRTERLRAELVAAEAELNVRDAGSHVQRFVEAPEQADE